MIVVNVKCKGERYLLGATQGFVLGKVVLLCTFSLIRKVSNICMLFVHVNLGLTASPGEKNFFFVFFRAEKERKGRKSTKKGLQFVGYPALKQVFC